MFQVKDFASIAASIINYAKAIQGKITDFSIGSVARTMLEAPAVEIEELYQQMFIGLRESIPVAIYQSFDFTRLPAAPASGVIRVTITPAATDTLIAAGMVFSSAAYSVKFVALADVTIAAGASYGDVSVVCTAPGAVGNVAASTSFTAYPSVNGLVSALALSTFNSGRDEETDAQRKARFATFIATLNRGTVAALRYGLSLVKLRDANGNVTEEVRHISIVEPWLTDPLQPISLVNCYIHNGSSGASPSLLTETEKIIYGYTDVNGNIIAGWKAAGVKVVIYAATNVTVNITCTVTVNAAYVVADVKAAVQAAISDYIAGLDIGDDVLVAEMVAAAMAVAGVDNFALTLPAGDTAVTNTQKAKMGTFTA